jgi:hypothetical protein
VEFNLKLTNTLETLNQDQNLPDSEQMIYMSGRALHPISINLAARLQEEFGGGLDISFLRRGGYVQLRRHPGLRLKAGDHMLGHPQTRRLRQASQYLQSASGHQTGGRGAWMSTSWPWQAAASERAGAALGNLKAYAAKVVH